MTGSRRARRGVGVASRRAFDVRAARNVVRVRGNKHESAVRRASETSGVIAQ